MKFCHVVIRIVIFLFFNSALSHELLAQQSKSQDIARADSLLIICDKHIAANENQVIHLATQALTIGKANHNNLCIAKSDYYLGKAHRQLGDYEKSLLYLTEAKTLFHTLDDVKRESLCLKEAGIVHYLINENDEAMENYTQALALAKASDFTTEIIAINNNIGNLFDRQQHYDEAIAHYEESLSMKPDDRLRATLLANLAKAYSGKNMNDKALTIYKNSLSISKKLNDTSGILTALGGIASLYWKEQKDDKVLEVSRNMLTIQQKADLKTEQIETYNRMGLSYLNLNDPEKAIIYLNNALQLGKQLHYTNQYLIHANLAFAYEGARQYKPAYEHFIKHKQLQDSLESKHSNKHIEELLARYEADKKEQKITMLQQEQQLQKFKLQKQLDELDKQTLIRNSIIIAAFLLLIPSIVLLIFYQQKVRSKVLLAQKTEEVNRQTTLELIREHEIKTIKANMEGREKERERIARDLHDGVAGSLAGIKLHLTRLNDHTNQGENLTAIIKNIDGVYEEVRTISHDLSPVKVLSKAFIDLIRSQLTQLAENSSFELDFICYPEEELNLLPDTIKIEVYRIIQELMTNIIKHADAKSVEVQFTKTEKYINLIVEDIGKGFDADKIVYGLGLNSIKKRVQRICGKLHIDSTKGRGTIINIDIPISA